MSSKPLWLGAPGIRDFLNLLVNRLDSAELRSSGKAQSIALTEKVWPALFKAPFESAKEELWEHVVEMCNWGWLKVKPEAALKSASGYAESPRIVVVDVAAVRKAVGRTERIKSSVERWRKAVNRGLLASEEAREAVGEFCIDMPDHSMDEVVERLNELPSLATQPLMLREASARLFWGMSKVLDKRQGLVAAVLGVDECPFPESPIQMQVYLPEGGYAAALFIENQMTFEQAIRFNLGPIRPSCTSICLGLQGKRAKTEVESGLLTVLFEPRGSGREIQGGIRELALWRARGIKAGFFLGRPRPRRNADTGGNTRVISQFGRLGTRLRADAGAIARR